MFNFASYPYNSSVWGPLGYIFDDFEQENEDTKQYLHNNYFGPMRETRKDIQIVSNTAIVPEFRTTMMSKWANFWQVTAHAAQWRYDTLNELLEKSYGTIDMKKSIEIISFLSPIITPGYWTNTIDDTGDFTSSLMTYFKSYNNSFLWLYYYSRPDVCDY